MEAQKANCPLCDSPGTVQLKWCDHFSIASCESCHLLFSSPMPEPEELAEFYQGFLYRMPEVSKIEDLADHKCSELDRHFGTRAPGSTFLDFGGGTGVTSCAARKLGWEVHFQDVDKKAHRFVSENLQIRSDRMYLSMDEIPCGHFDMIICDNVIEHVTNPVQLVIDLTERLKPGGSLVIKTPNAFNTELYFFPKISLLGYAFRAFSFSKSFATALKVMRKRIWHCDPPRHLFSFTKQSFEKLCQCARVTNFSVGHYNTPTFEYLFIDDVIRNPRLSKGWLLRSLLSIIELLAKPIYWLLKKCDCISSSGISLTINKESNS